MFQSFDNVADPGQGAARIARLRALMRAAKVDVFLVPRADEHQGEYVPPSAERLKWLTGFSGSAGLAAIALAKAALLVDGRYTVQAGLQVDGKVLEILQAPAAKLSDWIEGALPRGGTIGVDPWLHTAGEIERLAEALRPKGIKVRPLGANLVDKAWGKERPAPPQGRVLVHELRYAGKPAAEKIAVLQKQLVSERQDAVALTLPDSIAWLFNIRGSDVAHNPVALAFAIVPQSGKAELFIDPQKLDKAARDHLRPLAKLSQPADLLVRIKALKEAGRKVRLDPETAAWALFRALGGSDRNIARGGDPCILPKACKNETEIEGARLAHKRDGAAMARYLAWLDREAPRGALDEIMAVRALERMRADTQALREISFDTISGAGPNGAIVHYRVSTASNRRLGEGELFLVDSGAQYVEGTTDITRTVAIGKPTAEMRERFTLVLKGHIAIATACFPKGTRGIDLDPFARRALWHHGLDFDHGTGHGVGSYLSVHEGPQSISKRGMVALEPGMIISNEPGYYKAGAYGIRIENLVLVTPTRKVADGDREIMSFETLTLAPIDRRLVEASLLTAEERAWLDAYHARVAREIGPELAPADRAWLDAATAPLA